MAESTPQAKPKKLFLKQPIMVRVLIALAPMLVAGVYFFGWRVLALLAVCILGGVFTEWVMESRRGKPISMACFVTCSLYALSLPPAVPFWMALVGIVAAILFGKEVFGGFGRNFANPAIVGRTFVYIAFPQAMTGSFLPAFRGWPGGFARWSMDILDKAPAWIASVAHSGADAMTSATPMWARRDFLYDTPLGSLFFGHIGGTFETQKTFGPRVLAAGSVGELSALLILIGGVYLIATKTANWRLTLSTLLGAVASVFLLRTVAGFESVPSIPFTLCSGALMYGAVYMVTDPISAPKKKASMWIYGLVIGSLIVVLRWKAQFAGAVGFAILLGNILAPSLDMAVTALANRKKSPPEPKPEAS